NHCCYRLSVVFTYDVLYFRLFFSSFIIIFFHFFFFLIIQQPPISTLFPYTTLFRSNYYKHYLSPAFGSQQIGKIDRLRYEKFLRSEEHTSELQSRFDLVCRLLLEKKNKKNNFK